MQNIWAWHYVGEFGVQATFAKDPSKLPIKLNKTHFRLPVALEAPPNIEDEDALGWAFDFFNWVHSDFEAPNVVNESVRAHETHTSQSVGDIVEIEGRGFWIVLGVGWQKLNI